MKQKVHTDWKSQKPAGVTSKIKHYNHNRENAVVK